MPFSALEYHDIVPPGIDWNATGFPGNSAATYKMDAALFGEHLSALTAIDGNVGGDVRNIAWQSMSERIVLFTFDDGGDSAIRPAADMLEAHGWRGHFLITTSRIDTPGFLSTRDLQELDRRGHVVGAHSDSHPARMSLLSRADQQREWKVSKAKLEDAVGAKVEVASVPGGYFDQEVARAAAAEGIRWLFTSEPESDGYVVDGCAVIGRYTLRRSSAASVAKGLADSSPFSRSSQWMKWNAKKLAKRAAGDTYLRLRSKIFRDDPS